MIRWLMGLWPGWHKVSVRKPLAAAAFVWTMGLCTAAFCTGRDIPPGVQSVLIAVAPTCIAGYAASSAYEAVKAPKEEKDG
jgi:hypothetical protein